MNHRIIQYDEKETEYESPSIFIGKIRSIYLEKITNYADYINILK